MEIEPIAEFRASVFEYLHRGKEGERERERIEKGVRLGLSESIDFNYFNEAKYFDSKGIKLPCFHCGLSNSTEEKFSCFIILLTPMYDSGYSMIIELLTLL